MIDECGCCHHDGHKGTCDLHCPTCKAEAVYAAARHLRDLLLHIDDADMIREAMRMIAFCHRCGSDQMGEQGFWECDCEY